MSYYHDFSPVNEIEYGRDTAPTKAGARELAAKLAIEAIIADSQQQ